jgi:ribosomal protein S18 acetylase RimI-like enzyme
MTTLEATLRFGVVGDSQRLADLHAEQIGEGFLSSLGPRFLRRLYGRVVRSDGAFAVVAEHEGEVVAFCAAAEDVRRFYVEFVARDSLMAGVAAAPRLLRAVPRALETLRYPGTTGSLPRAEILSVVTDRHVTGHGLGSRVLTRALAELRARGCDAAKVVTGAGNEPALRMYERCGFATRRSISIHEDVPSEVLVWACF